MSTKKKAVSKKKLESPLTRFMRRIKRIILILSMLLFFGFLYAAYSEFAPAAQSRVGRVGLWSTRAVLSPIAKSLPIWFYLGVGFVALYLWTKHKLVMSIVLGCIAGIAMVLFA